MSTESHEPLNFALSQQQECLKEAILMAAAAFSVTGEPAHRMDKVREQLAEFRARHSSGAGKELLDQEAAEILAMIAPQVERRG